MRVCACIRHNLIKDRLNVLRRSSETLGRGPKKLFLKCKVYLSLEPHMDTESSIPAANLGFPPSLENHGQGIEPVSSEQGSNDTHGHC